MSTGVELQAITAVELTWTSQTGKVYQVHWTHSIERPDWQNLGPPVMGTGGALSLFDSARQYPHAFYRVRLVP